MKIIYEKSKEVQIALLTERKSIINFMEAINGNDFNAKKDFA